ncbi:MAG TPA: DUF378 domain-containing protein [Candidatus Krumholzibacteria bacterium]|nr:DUF378 domain-containing protein [Candidatus Krumholzibacteria bacterium]
MKQLDLISGILLVVGGLNWGLVGLFGFDLAATIFGDMSALSRLVYTLVGLSALYQAVQWQKIRSRWQFRQTVSATS